MQAQVPPANLTDALLEQIPVPAVLLDVAGGAATVQSANAWARQLLTCPEEGPCSLQDAWGSWGADDLERDILRCLRLGERIVLDVVHGTARNPRHFRAHVAPCASANTARVILTLVEITAERVAERAAHAERKRLRRANQHDALTSALTRRHFFRSAAAILEAATEAAEPCAAIMIDLDHFKALNDTFGHDVGDRALVDVSGTCLGMLRDTDLFGRLGGEEFALLLPGLELAQARRIAERIRIAIEQLDIATRQGPTKLTVSLGLTLVMPGEALADCLQRADQALYHAKRAGRNLMVVYEEISWAEEDQ